MAKQVAHIHVARQQGLHIRQVASRQLDVGVAFRQQDQSARVDLQVVQHRHDFFGLRAANLQILHDHQLIVADLGRTAPIASPGDASCAASAAHTSGAWAQRRCRRRANAGHGCCPDGPAGAFLAPRLATTASDLASVLDFMRAAAGIGKLADERLVHDGLIDRCSEDIVTQLNLADLFSGRVVNWYQHRAHPCFLRLADNHQAALGARNGAAHDDHGSFGVDTHDPQALYGDLTVAHVTRPRWPL